MWRVISRIVGVTWSVRIVGHSEKGSVPDREREVGFATLNSRIARDPTAMAIAGSSPIDHESLPRIRAIVRPDLARPNSTSGSARSNSKVFWFEAGFCGKCFQCSPRPLAVDQRQRLSAVPNSFTDNIGLRRLSGRFWGATLTALKTPWRQAPAQTQMPHSVDRSSHDLPA